MVHERLADWLEGFEHVVPLFDVEVITRSNQRMTLCECVVKIGRQQTHVTGRLLTATTRHSVTAQTRYTRILPHKRA